MIRSITRKQPTVFPINCLKNRLWRNGNVQWVREWCSGHLKGFYASTRDAKMYEGANNVRVKCFLARVKRCFVTKVSYVANSRFFVEFVGTFWNFMLLFGFFSLTIRVIWAFYAVLLRIRYVLIYALFWVKLLWLKPCPCTKIVFLHLWAQHFEIEWGWGLNILKCPYSSVRCVG